MKTQKAYAITVDLDSFHEDSTITGLYERKTLSAVVEEAARDLGDTEVELYEVTYKFLGKKRIVFPTAKLQSIKPLKEG